MSAEIKSGPGLEIAHVLFIGIVGDSKLLIDQGPRFQSPIENQRL